MPSKKDIDRRIKSVKNTKKITYAMKLVSAAKLKRAQESVVNARTYTESLAELLSLLQASAGTSSAAGSTAAVTDADSSDDSSNSKVDLSHPLLSSREVRNVLVVVIGGARGLAGGYNSSLNKKVDSFIAQLSQRGLKVSSLLISKKPAEYYRRIGRQYAESYEDISEEPLKWPIAQIGKQIADKFTEAAYDEVYVIYTKFKSAISSVPVVEKLLPLTPPEAKATDTNTASGSAAGGTKVLFEPSPQVVFSKIVPQIFRSLLQQACLDAKASEHASRMTAMDAATKNAGELITKLTLLSNKLRQQKITSELLDIIGGAEAVA